MTDTNSIALQDLSHFARIASFLCQHAETQFGVPCPAGSVGSSGMLAEIEEHSETGPIAEVGTQYCRRFDDFVLYSPNLNIVTKS